MLLIIDNYDSFTYNLYQFFGELGSDIRVIRNDDLMVKDIKSLSPEKIVISPGPCTPSEAGISTQLITQIGQYVPILGVCLGHQCIASAYGAKISNAGEIIHGKTSKISHDGKGVFAGIPNEFKAIRYHSLAVQKDTLPSVLSVTATSESGVIMGIRHNQLKVEGIQFHPESIITEYGKKLLQNFLEINVDG